MDFMVAMPRKDRYQTADGVLYMDGIAFAPRKTEPKSNVDMEVCFNSVAAAERAYKAIMRGWGEEIVGASAASMVVQLIQNHFWAHELEVSRC